MTARDRRALRIGGAIALIALILLRVLPAVWRGWRTASADLAAQEALLVRAETALTGLDSVASRSQLIQQRVVALAPKLLAGASDAEALADLNGRVVLAAGRQRTRVLRADPVPDSTREARLHRVRLRVEVESDWAGLASFLRATVADPAALRITSIAIRGPEVPGATTGSEVLTGEVEVTGWYLSSNHGNPGGMR